MILHKWEIGYQFGVTGEYKLTSSFAIAPELQFASQGVKGDDMTNIINYVQLPILARYYPSENFSLEFGPQFGVAVFNHMEGQNMPGALYNDFECALAIGTSYSFTSHVYANLRYTMGLTNVYKTDYVDKSNGSYNIALSLGYRF